MRLETNQKVVSPSEYVLNSSASPRINANLSIAAKAGKFVGIFVGFLKIVILENQ